MGKLEEILSGWKNLIKKDPLVEIEAKRRAKICSDCPSARVKVGVLKCNECGCPLAAKTRSMGSECPLKKW